MTLSVLRSEAAPAVAGAQDPAELHREIAQLAPNTLLLELGTLQVFCAPAAALPLVLLEIGRLREMTFRAVGEGTGKALDIDTYDAHYQHLFVWNRDSREIVGAYRLALTHPVMQGLGVEGLYTHSLFDFDVRLLERLGPSLELGRSFVRPECQGSTRALRLLWAGIAVVLDRHPEVYHLFGPVSVSPRFSELGRMLIMSALQLHHMDPELKCLIQARNAPQAPAHPWHHRLNEVSAGLADPGRLSRFLKRLEQGMALPMLIKHYIELKGRFAGFNIDHAFSGTLDGLVFVRVHDIPHKLRTRLTRSAPP
ncbi:GNAT family N-acetyltransferase [Rhodoferax aquaticus]|uniref:L-ornithine N(alpha)-acyltransferase n=1 Tax=Rhodoferax aquaticus TaxID=2527691 RepID=A0A515ESF7_9BURK|nr:GNAT family N-acetyltransferase [Rhodoferax aquaticus]QDL55590.1 GNAT family N-acetyltransferase [Rhodoferax aquaticus]